MSGHESVAAIPTPAGTTGDPAVTSNHTAAGSPAPKTCQESGSSAVEEHGPGQQGCASKGDTSGGQPGAAPDTQITREAIIETLGGWNISAEYDALSALVGHDLAEVCRLGVEFLAWDSCVQARRDPVPYDVVQRELFDAIFARAGVERAS